jgi:diaminopimelate epimerase
VSFFRTDGHRVRARIFERGVGETLSSGTGASGAAVAAHLAGAPGELTVELDGGELEVEIGDELSVRLTGWAEPVYAGELSAELLAELEALS